MTRRSFKAIVEWITEPLTERPFSLGRVVGFVILVLVICRLLLFYVEIIQRAISPK